MPENEKTLNNESSRSGADIVKGWIAELDGQIREKERLLATIRGRENNLFYAKLKAKLEEELPELRGTFMEYKVLLEEAEPKKP